MYIASLSAEFMFTILTKKNKNHEKVLFLQFFVPTE